MPQVEVLTEASERTDVDAAPVRSVRRATARRASHRRATARSRQGDSETSIIDFLARHPGSTIGDLARGLNFNPVTVSIRLTQLANSGEIKKVRHGYNTKQATDPARSYWPPLRAQTEPSFPGAAVSIRGAARHRVLRCPGLGPAECAAAAPFAGRSDRACVTAWERPIPI